MLDIIFNTLIDTGNSIATTWILVFVVTGAVVGLSRIFRSIKKIQDRKGIWMRLRHELSWSAANLTVTTIVLSTLSSFLVESGALQTNPDPAAWYVVIFEFMLYFFIFDIYFYTVHRLMHIQPLYKWIHLTHHRSTSPNPLSSSSMNPIEGVVEGLIIPIFLSMFTVHDASTALIVPFATLMGLYVHCGYELVPRWWYHSALSKWIISPMFHDQHHQYFNYNYGGFTTIWDRVFGTVRPQFTADFDKLKGRKIQAEKSPEATV